MLSSATTEYPYRLASISVRCDQLQLGHGATVGPPVATIEAGSPWARFDVAVAERGGEGLNCDVVERWTD